AAVDVLPERYPGWVDAATEGAWRWLVDQVSVWPGDTLISSELLALARPDEVARVMATLDFAEVHLVCTARDLVRQIPSVWQEDVKNRRTNPYDEFVRFVRAGREAEIAALFWSYQDLPGVLATWGAGVPPQRVHVITVPPRGASSDLLWQRYASVVGVDADRFDTSTPPTNSSLDMAQTEMLRRLNLVVGESIPWPEYVRVVKGEFAEDVLPSLRGRGAITLPADDHEWATGVARESVAAIEAAGYHVVGDLADLVPRPVAGAEVPKIGDAEVAEVAVRTLAEIMRRAARPAGHPSAPPGLRRLLVDLSEQNDQVMAMRRMYRRTKARMRNARRRG
ncbi:MAG TPA: hypothetical protein VHV49_11495, partial [Pseudonocardiaceae bacterium]|nr:hypothetical protein [Pseudonocardiaceae bacterium]